MAKLDDLHPTLRRKVLAILSDLRGHGENPKLACAWRSPEDQLALYRAGRSKVRFSFHNATKLDGTPCGLAADIVDAAKGWYATKRFWTLLGRSAKAHGLTWGGDWDFYDPAHVQLLPNSKLTAVKNGWLPPVT